MIADSGLLSKENISQLEKEGYGYIIGARIKKSDKELTDKILSLGLEEDGALGEIRIDGTKRIIISYSQKRAAKDHYNRQRGLKRLEKKLRSGKLTKEHLNNRGYNKYLTLENEVKVSIDYESYEADGNWDGLKGYLSNTDLSAQNIVNDYANLWHIEKAFRMNKSDLQIRPIYHFVKRRIEAHISICFVAYSVYKEVERILAKHHAPFSVDRVRDIVHNLYQITVILPDSGITQEVLLNLDDEQKLLLDIIGSELG